MVKTEKQLDAEYYRAMQFFMIVGGGMRWGKGMGDPDNPYGTYAKIAKYYADRKADYKEHYLQTITDLQTMAEKELDSWEAIGDAAYTGLDDRNDAKKWLLEEVLPPLIAEAERRGWKKPA